MFAVLLSDLHMATNQTHWAFKSKQEMGISVFCYFTGTDGPAGAGGGDGGLSR